MAVKVCIWWSLFLYGARLPTVCNRISSKSYRATLIKNLEVKVGVIMHGVDLDGI